MMRCLILMTSYNGEKFIGQQIESICNQSFKDWHLLIRDDGSKDKTVAIIQSYIDKDNRIKLIENTTEKHGAYLNFWTLINYAKSLPAYDYYFFADQDDLWVKDKLQIMTNYALKSEFDDEPLMLYSDMEIIDEKNRQLLPSINEVMGNGEMKGYSLFFTHGFIWGCAAMANRKLFSATPIFPLDDPRINIMSHDNYYGKFALMLGKVKFVNQVLIRHRRHTDNTTGEYRLKLDFATVFKKAIFQFNDLAKTHARVYNQTLLTLHQMEQSGIDRKEVSVIRSAICKGGLKGAYYLKKLGVHRKQFSRTIGIYLVMLTGSYRKYLFEI